MANASQYRVVPCHNHALSRAALLAQIERGNLLQVLQPPPMGSSHTHTIPAYHRAPEPQANNLQPT
jgi:hypothetical protein